MTGPPRQRWGSDSTARAGQLAVVALAALLVISVVAVAAVPSGSLANSQHSVDDATTVPVEPQTNTAAYLALPDADRQTSRIVTVGIDPAAASAVETARLHGEFRRERLVTAFERADSDSARREVVLNTTARIDRRIDTLETRQATALAEYNRGEITTNAFLRELAAIDATARELEPTIAQLYTYDRAVGLPVSDNEIARLKSRLVPLSGPVRSRIADHMADGTPQRVHLTTSDSGIALGTIVEESFSTQYVREAFVGDNFDDQFSDNPISIADDFRPRLQELYPWVFASDPGYDTVLTSEPYHLRAGVYGMSINHPHGTVDDGDLVVYYDADTDAIFYEIQRKDVSTIPTTRTATNESGYRLEVGTTHLGGPLSIDVINASSGEAVDVPVRVNNDSLGRTDGKRLWTVVPARSFNVTAVTPDGNVTVTANV